MNIRMPPGRPMPAKDDMARDLERVRTSVTRAIGTRDALKQRHDALERDVGLAKGRIAMKGEIDKFIQEWQADIYRQNTHSIETLLTTIARDILPGATPIALDLSTERGLPALDISAVGMGGAREDIYEDQGGAVNNVISLGLRLIAVVKLGGSRFLGLDEPDCWVKPDRIPAFFEVLGDASRRLGVQTLSITHHSDLATFGRDVRVSAISRPTPDASVITCDQPAYPWTDDEAGFRYVRLVDFQAFEETTISLSPGVNVIVGTNNFGKSCVIGALRAMFYGTLRDSQIRHGKPSMTVELGLPGGRTLRLVRERRGNPKNQWTLLEQDGSVVVEQGQTRQTGGNKPPEWLDELLGIHQVEDLDIHLPFQKEPVFLLDKPASKRATVLSMGRESGYTHDMLAIQKENNARDAATVRDGEREIGTIRVSLQSMAVLDEFSAQLEQADALKAHAEEWATYLKGLESIAEVLRTLGAEAAVARARHAAYADLPEEGQLASIRTRLETSSRKETAAARLLAARRAVGIAEAKGKILSSLPDAVPATVSSEKMETTLGRLLQAGRAVSVAAARRQSLEQLPSATPAITETAASATALARIRAAEVELERARSKARDLVAREKEARSEIDALVEASGSRCPTCGHAVDSESLINHHHAA